MRTLEKFCDSYVKAGTVNDLRDTGNIFPNLEKNPELKDYIVADVLRFGEDPDYFCKSALIDNANFRTIWRILQQFDTAREPVELRTMGPQGSYPQWIVIHPDNKDAIEALQQLEEKMGDSNSGLFRGDGLSTLLDERDLLEVLVNEIEIDNPEDAVRLKECSRRLKIRANKELKRSYE
jgi:hypothetical protein|tara:strand:+ start:297 stop:833 length:537 start_codon:yes stop_codon:yes gene_type:complete